MFNNGDAAIDFLNGTVNFNGAKAAANRNISDLTKYRRLEEAAIIQNAKARGLSVKDALQKILVNSAPELATYILAHRESPNADPEQLAAQAVLLRAADIAKVAQAQDIPDEEALQMIERSEQEAVEMSSADANTTLSPDLGAAIKMVLDAMAYANQKNGGNGSMFAILTGSGANSFDFSREQLLSVPGDPLGPIGSPSPGGTTEGNVSYPDVMNNPDYASGEGASDPTGSSVSGSTTGGSSSSGGFWAVLDKITGAITGIGNAVKSTSGQVSNAGNVFQDVGSDIGAQSINKSLKQNLPYIIGAVILVIVIIIIIIYASRRRK